MIKIDYGKYQEMKQKHEKEKQELNLSLIQNKQNINFKTTIDYTNQHQEIKQSHTKQMTELKLNQAKEAQKEGLKVNVIINYLDENQMKERHEKAKEDIEIRFLSDYNYYNLNQLGQIANQINIQCSEEEEKQHVSNYKLALTIGKTIYEKDFTSFMKTDLLDKAFAYYIDYLKNKGKNINETFFYKSLDYVNKQKLEELSNSSNEA